MSTIFRLIRAVVYATLFVGFWFVLLPSMVLRWSGAGSPMAIGIVQLAGLLLVVLGAAVVAWCILSFVFIGRGTQAPFEPPRALVVRGPYRFMRNPMYAGAVMGLAGGSLYFESPWLAAFTMLVWLVLHMVVTRGEEPALRQRFGADYERYLGEVRRW